eukprot:8244920-Alexandrium_andersonii.AAC.1
MSASLVGSEMCIRDRQPFCLAEPQTYEGELRDAARGLRDLASLRMKPQALVRPRKPLYGLASPYKASQATLALSAQSYLNRSSL